MMGRDLPLDTRDREREALRSSIHAHALRLGDLLGLPFMRLARLPAVPVSRDHLTITADVCEDLAAELRALASFPPDELEEAD